MGCSRPSNTSGERIKRPIIEWGPQTTVGFDAIDTALAGGTDVAIKADNSIHWNGDYTPTSISGERTLTLQSGHNDGGTGRYVFGNIFFNGDIDASGAGNGNSLALILNGKIALNTDVSLKSNGGNVVFAGVVDSDAVANNRPILAHFHEWMGGVAVPRIAHLGLPVATESTDELPFPFVAGPAECVVLDRCGHVPHREQPERVLARVSRFVASCREPEPHG